MIDVLRYERILEEGLILDHYFLLLSLRDGIEMPKTKRMRGFLNLLTKKGYVKDNALTEKAFIFLGSAAVTVTTTTGQVDFLPWVSSLYEKCRSRLKELTGSEQVTARIGRGKGYPFLPNAIDLGKKIKVFMSAYKINDLQKIEDQIISYIDSCKADNEWFPILKYYIMKDGESLMATHMLSPTDKQIVKKSNQKHI